MIEGTPLYTVEEDPREENITYAEAEHREIVVLENKIKDISLHILENIFNDISIKSDPSDHAGVDADDANDPDRSDADCANKPPNPAPRPFYTFSFAKKVKILKELL